MTLDVEAIVRKEFELMCRTFHLAVRKISDNEIALVGKAFLLLLWFDRDGASVKYVRLDRSKLEAFDVGSFIAMKRGWDAFGPPPGEEDIPTRLRRECSSYALNIQKFAADMLQGQTDWIKEISGSPIILNDNTTKAIRGLWKPKEV